MAHSVWRRISEYVVEECGPSPYSILWTMPPSNSHKYAEKCLRNILSKVTTPEPVSSSSNDSHVDVREIKSNALTPSIDKMVARGSISDNAAMREQCTQCPLWWTLHTQKVQLRSPQQTDLLGDGPCHSPPQNLSLSREHRATVPQQPIGQGGSGKVMVSGISARANF